MNKKYLSKTYLWESTNYSTKFIISNELDYYASIKHIIKRNKPFVVSNGDCLINNGYYMVEILPKNENYSMRVFFNEKKEILQYYFDVTFINELDKELGVPYYIDLYLDVIYSNGKIELLDYNELEEALQNGIISEDTFNLANITANKLMDELKLGTNKYFNLDLISLLK